MDDETLEKQLALEWKDEDLSEQIEKEEKVTLMPIEIYADQTELFCCAS